MDAPFPTAHELVRPWRRATLVASSVAAIELVLLIGAVALLVAKPLARAIQRQAAATAVARPSTTRTVKPVVRKRAAPPPVGWARPRDRLKIMVFNGNGRSGAAAGEASKLQSLGYGIAGTANAHRQDYATTVVMYSPGYRAEGLRLARDLQVKAVGPLDGMRTSALGGGQLAVVIGA